VISPEDGEIVYRQLEEGRREFGEARLKLGAALALIFDHEIWKGRATTWSAFLADQRLHPSAARDFIAIARVFVFDETLAPRTAEEGASLAAASVKILKAAADIITGANRDQVYGIVGQLGNLDAGEALAQLKKGPQSFAGDVLAPRDRRVESLLRLFYELPMEARIETLSRLRLGQTPKS
jgi:hypothetical protein